MAGKQAKICFKANEFGGSRFRCLLATHQSRDRVLRFLSSCVSPYGAVGEDDRYIPDGFRQPDEAKLGETPGFLDEKRRKEIREWWLAVQKGANTPNWDIVSTCTVDGRPGLILIEAKAHPGELAGNDRCRAGNKQNQGQISKAIGEANTHLGQGWSLQASRRYQLSNRFAFAWKVASMGVPVILVYLGFLNATEMPKPFTSQQAWEECLKSYCIGCMPPAVWNAGPIMVHVTPLIPLIRSAEVNIACQSGLILTRPAP